MQVKQSVVSGNGEQKASKNSKVENVAVPKTGAINALGELQNRHNYRTCRLI